MLERTRPHCILSIGGLMLFGSAATAQTVTVGSFDSSRAIALTDSSAGGYSVLADVLTSPAFANATGTQVALEPPTATLSGSYLDGVDLLVITGGSNALTTIEVGALRSWFDGGGNLLVLGRLFGMELPVSAIEALDPSLEFSTLICFDASVSQTATPVSDGLFGDVRGATLRSGSGIRFVGAIGGFQPTTICDIGLFNHVSGGWAPPGDIGASGSGRAAVFGGVFFLNSYVDPQSSSYDPANELLMRNALAAVAVPRDDSIGVPYCTAAPNSTGSAGDTRASGSNAVLANDVTLEAVGLPSMATGFFITSTSMNFVMGAGGSSGNLCVGGAIGRFVGPGQIGDSGLSGSFSLLIDLTSMPQPSGSVAVAPGETWYVQAWHRDNAGGSATSNLTRGLSITFM